MRTEGIKILAVMVATVLLAQGAAAGVEVGAVPPPGFGTDQHGDGVDGLPHMVIVGSDGQVSSIRLGYSEEQVIEVIEELHELLRAQEIQGL